MEWSRYIGYHRGGILLYHDFMNHDIIREISNGERHGIIIPFASHLMQNSTYICCVVYSGNYKCPYEQFINRDHFMMCIKYMITMGFLIAVFKTDRNNTPIDVLRNDPMIVDINQYLQ